MLGHQAGWSFRLALHEVPTDAVGDAGCGVLHGVPGQVGVPGRGLNLRVPQELAYHGQALTKHQRPRGEAMPEVMNSHVLQLGAVRMRRQGF